MNPELCSESLTLSVFVELFWFAVVWSISSTTLTRTESAGLILTVGNGRWNNKQKWHFEQPTFPRHEIFIIVFSIQRIFYVLYFDLSIYIYIYAFSRHFYPKQLTGHSGYTLFVSMCVPWDLNPQPFALLTQYSTTEPQEHLSVYLSIYMAVFNWNMYYLYNLYLQKTVYKITFS